MSHTEEPLRQQSRAHAARPTAKSGTKTAAKSGAKPGARHTAPKSASAAGSGRHSAAGQSGGTKRKRPAASQSGAAGGRARKRKRRLTPFERFKRFCRRYRALLLLICAVVLIAAVACALIFGARGGHDETPATSEATIEPASASPEVTPSPTPTEEPTATPEPTPTPEPTLSPEEMHEIAYPPEYKIVKGTMQTDRSLGLPEGEKVDDSFFNDTCFVGDSVTLGLQRYVMKMRKNGYPNLLGNAGFLATGSFRIYDALGKVTKNSLHPTYKGKKMTLEEVLAKRKVKKVYLMLGLNDVAGVGVDKTVSNMGKLIQRIQKKNPGIQIFIESVTPRMHGVEPATGTLFKYDHVLYDQLVKAKLENVFFVDVAYVMRDDSGYLQREYCSDPDGMAMHMTDNGCNTWIKYLYTHTPPTVASLESKKTEDEGDVSL